MRLALITTAAAIAACTARPSPAARAPQYSRADTAAILRAAPADSRWTYPLQQIVRDTAWLLSRRRPVPSDTVVESYNGQQIKTVKGVTKGYERVVRRNGQWVRLLSAADTFDILSAVTVDALGSVDQTVADTAWVLIEQTRLRVHRRDGQWVRVRPDGSDTTTTKP